MKNLTIEMTIKIKKSVIWRIKLFKAIMLFAVWVGGFGGIEYIEEE